MILVSRLSDRKERNRVTMLKSHEQFHSQNGKRRVLVVDDEMTNREILGLFLEDEYDVQYAEDGITAMNLIRENREILSLVLLDLLMPGMSGQEVLLAMRDDPELAGIPVIVLTADQEAEVECLGLGAMDFIPKPYPAVSVVKARIRRTIELSEDRDIIQSTERDELTGLYNRDYFYRYAKQYDQHHRNQEMDAVVIDINHFHLINERYGKGYGDEILRRIGQKSREIFSESGGFVCRREADTFMVYCPHREDYREVMNRFAEGLTGDTSSDNRVRLRAGVYQNSDKSIDIERRFDRAKNAADTIKGSFSKTIAYYDNELLVKELFSEQLIEDFYKAVEERQFVVHYQPKFDVRPDTPVLTSAEALVRWNHPTLGTISPGIFIPLFEQNGLIRRLDSYVWEEACRQIRDWNDRFGIEIPVSVNVSRIDLYDENLIPTLQRLIREHGLSYDSLMLEVTESAYTQDTDQIIDIVERLRRIGFKIEMDDFGTGYSSLNMVSTLPFDVMKLDMRFTRNAFREGGDTRMLELIIDIAEYLEVPVIAEGVETEYQMKTLRAMGVGLIQGYYFSKPVEPEEFECFLKERIELEKNEENPDAPAEDRKLSEQTPETVQAEPETAAAEAEPEAEKTGEEQIASADTSVRRSRLDGIRLKKAMSSAVLFALAAAILLFVTDLLVNRGYQRMENASDRYIEAQNTASELESASDYLTDRVRCFVVTGDLQYLQDFFEEVEVTKRRDHAVSNLEEFLQDDKGEALSSLNEALNLSNELVGTEYLAMRLKLETIDYDPKDIPDVILSIRLGPEYQSMSKEEMNDLAQKLVFDENYMDYKARIRENVNGCTESLMRSSSAELERASSRMARTVSLQTLMTVLFLMIVLLIVYLINELILKPLMLTVDRMQKQEPIPPMGAEELQYVTNTFNRIFEENRRAQERLKHEASHDALTGLLNRGAYELLMKSVDMTHIAMILLDVDYFKSVNDRYGHDVGDRVLKRVASILKQSFRSVDIICRIGGDEFVVIMTRVNSTHRQLVQNKIAAINERLQHPEDDVPPVSLSVGVAFADRENPQGDIFKDADTALFRVKEAGRNGCEIF